MKVALLLPGYLDSPDYLHLKTFDKRLSELGYTVERLDPCNLWKTGDVNNYSVTNYIKHIKDRIDHYNTQLLEEVVLIGHSLGGFTSILAGNLLPEVTKIVALCPPSSIEGLGKKWEDKPFRISKRDLPNDSLKYREFNVPLTFVEDARKYSVVKVVSEMKKPLMVFISLTDASVAPEETEILVSSAVNPHVARTQGIRHDFRRSQEECNIVMSEIENFLGQ